MTAAAPRHSALYRGWLQHRRWQPDHRFRRRVCLLYLDLAELDTVFAGRWFWSTRRPAPARFHRADHLGPADVPLDVAVRDEAERLTGTRPQGAIRLLTQLRSFGWAFNPVSFYYCFDRQDRLQTVLAEITNTPWRERHRYAVTAPAGGAGPGGVLRGEFAKRFHVSPFLPMELRYHWQLAVPGERLWVRMQDRAGDRRVFDAALVLDRESITAGSLCRALLRHPCPALSTSLAIYRHALRLWWKGATFHTHPSKRRTAVATGERTP